MVTDISLHSLHALGTPETPPIVATMYFSSCLEANIFLFIPYAVGFTCRCFSDKFQLRNGPSEQCSAASNANLSLYLNASL